MEGGMDAFDTVNSELRMQKIEKRGMRLHAQVVFDQLFALYVGLKCSGAIHQQPTVVIATLFVYLFQNKEATLLDPLSGSHTRSRNSTVESARAPFQEWKFCSSMSETARDTGVYLA